MVKSTQSKNISSPVCSPVKSSNSSSLNNNFKYSNITPVKLEVKKTSSTFKKVSQIEIRLLNSEYGCLNRN